MTTLLQKKSQLAALQEQSCRSSKYRKEEEDGPSRFFCSRVTKPQPILCLMFVHKYFARQKKNYRIICTKKWKKYHFPKNSHLTRTENDGAIKDTVCACQPRRFSLFLQPFLARSGTNGLNLVCLSGCGNISIEPKELDLHWANPLDAVRTSFCW